MGRKKDKKNDRVGVFRVCANLVLCEYAQPQIGSKSKHREMETYETNPDFARVSFLRNTKSAALGVSGFEKRNIRVPRAVSPAIRLYISFPSSGMWGDTGETGRRREQAKY